nr:uncharacterized protein LOC102148134 isoform X3 [Equus caballus]XP_023509898.1 uncharacterized protein LOC102148134 isoform X3 [Equus caballus]
MRGQSGANTGRKGFICVTPSPKSHSLFVSWEPACKQSFQPPTAQAPPQVSAWGSSCSLSEAALSATTAALEQLEQGMGVPSEEAAPSQRALLPGLPEQKGFCTMMLEKTRERCWMTHTIFTNVLSSCIALIGLLLISLELAIFSSSKKRVIWPQKCGKLLSEYLWLFTSLQFLVSCVVMHWILKAKYRR